MDTLEDVSLDLRFVDAAARPGLSTGAVKGRARRTIERIRTRSDDAWERAGGEIMAAVACHQPNANLAENSEEGGAEWCGLPLGRSPGKPGG